VRESTQRRINKRKDPRTPGKDELQPPRKSKREKQILAKSYGAGEGRKNELYDAVFIVDKEGSSSREKHKGGEENDTFMESRSMIRPGQVRKKRSFFWDQKLERLLGERGGTKSWERTLFVARGGNSYKTARRT